MKVLGVHIGHDSSSALIIDGKIVADVAEERFVRIKHYAGLPIQSIQYCLDYGKVNITDIDIIAVPSENPMPALNHLFKLEGVRKEKTGGKLKRIEEFTRYVMNKPEMKIPLYIKNFPISKQTEIFKVGHHLAHATSAYYTSGINEPQLIVTMDGQGDGVTTGIWRGVNGKITPLKMFGRSASLGFFYSNVTEALGWWHGDGEGKTMGLAPYGDYSKTLGLLDSFYPKFANGDLIEEHDYGRSFFWNERGATQWHFDEAYEIKKLVDKYGREDMAAEAQKVLEEQVKEIVFPWMEREKTENLSCSGGVFLNVKLNQRLWEYGKIAHHHIYPNCGDSGLAVGAALYAYFVDHNDQPIPNIAHLYFGPQFSNDEIKKILDLRNIQYEFVENIGEKAAQYLAEGKIVAWFQGRMESGPRALGNRSILMSASKRENKDIINARVKFREAFRPFCPSLLYEKKDDYLKNNREEPFMITSFDVTDSKRDRVPAVVHKDGTLRPQTVRKDVNPKYWNLINEFGKLTGEYLLLNTSLNIMGEPIICHPREAIRCFYDNGLDVLLLGNFLLRKP